MQSRELCEEIAEFSPFRCKEGSRGELLVPLCQLTALRADTLCSRWPQNNLLAAILHCIFSGAVSEATRWVNDVVKMAAPAAAAVVAASEMTLQSPSPLSLQLSCNYA